MISLLKEEELSFNSLPTMPIPQENTQTQANIKRKENNNTYYSTDLF